MLTIITNTEKLKVRKMGDISKNFSRSEFACKCNCGFATVDVKLLEVLEITRVQFNKPIKINSGCRCEEYNKVINGAKESKHKIGQAADIVVKDIDPIDVYKFLDMFQPNKYGVKLYNTFVHIDVRETKWRSKG
tara:strand:+ start:4935 stop:5336 length:402 start_codon:yes stop_codon:yes gene_type:complete